MLGHHIRNSGEEIHSFLHLERSQALFAIRRAYGYNLLLFSPLKCVLYAHTMFMLRLLILTSKAVFNVTMQKKSSNVILASYFT